MKMGRKFWNITMALTAAACLAVAPVYAQSTGRADLDAMLLEQQRILDELQGQKQTEENESLREQIDGLQEELRAIRRDREKNRNYDSEGAIDALAVQIANLAEQLSMQTSAQQRIITQKFLLPFLGIHDFQILFVDGLAKFFLLPLGIQQFHRLLGPLFVCGVPQFLDGVLDAHQFFRLLIVLFLRVHELLLQGTVPIFQFLDAHRGQMFLRGGILFECGNSCFRSFLVMGRLSKQFSLFRRCIPLHGQMLMAESRQFLFQGFQLFFECVVFCLFSFAMKF